MPRLVELIRTRKAGRPGPDDGYRFSGALLRGHRCDPALVEGTIDDVAFHALDGDSRFQHSQYTRPFAGRGAHPAGELREVVRLVQPIQCLTPQPLVCEVIPLRDEVVDGAPGCSRAAFGKGDAGVTEGNTAIHASGALLPKRVLRQVFVELIPVVYPLRGTTVGRELTRELQESGGFSHCCPLSIVCADSADDLLCQHRVFRPDALAEGL